MRSVPAPVFTTSQALAAGWTRNALLHAVSTCRLVRLRRGIYTDVVPPTDLEFTIAAALAHPGAVVSHRSAAVMYDLPLIGRSPRVPELTVAPRAATSDAGVHMYRATLDPGKLVMIGGIRVTSPAQTVVDVARHAPVATSVALADAVLNRGMAQPEEVEAALVACAVWPRIRRAHRALRLVDGRSESALESLSRLALRRYHLPTPELQRVFVGPDGAFVGRVDFFWEGYGVVGEADGALKYATQAALLAEKRRQELLEDLGLIVVRWGWDDVWLRPAALAARVEAALRRGQARRRSGFHPEYLLPEAGSKYSG